MTASQNLTTLHPENSINASNVTAFRQQLNQAIDDSKTSEVLIDLEQVQLIDSAAVVVLVQATRRAQAQGKELGICHANSQVRMILELTQLDQFVQLYANEQEFVHRHYQLMAA